LIKIRVQREEKERTATALYPCKHLHKKPHFCFEMFVPTKNL